MSYVLVIAGASGSTFQLLEGLSSSLLAPGGVVIRIPVTGNDSAYSARYVRSLVRATSSCVSKVPEQEPVSILLLYLNASDRSESVLLDAFFPMALPFSISVIDPYGDGQLLNRKAIKKLIVEGAQRLRDVYPKVSDKTQVANISPLLLPLRNFRSGALTNMLKELYDRLGKHDSPGDLIGEVVNRFKTLHPPVKPPDGAQHCYTDGNLYFKSPGRNRHGFFRNAGKNAHSDECILRARSRLGGSIPYTLHYDCTPLRQLAKAYPNCHCEDTPPKEKHVNIGPSDFII